MTAPIILIGNEKGGTGKTTVSVSIAAMAAASGIDVLLVDSDPGQRSASKWAGRRKEFHPEAAAVPCVAVTGKDTRPELENLARRYQLIVVDTGAEDSPEMRAASLVAARLVIPVQPEAFDLWQLPTVETIFERARTLNDRLRPLLVVNRIPYQLADSAMTDVASFIADHVPGLAAAPMVPLIGRSAYGKASGEGLAASEMARRDAKATSELQRLYREVLSDVQ